MKKNIFLFFTMFIASIIIAQQCPKLGKKGIKTIKNRNDWEIGVNLFSLSNCKSIYSLKDISYYHFNTNKLSGLFYKLHLKKYTLRTSFDFTHNLMEQNKQYWNNNKYDLRIGIEKTFNKKKAQLFIASDISFAKSVDKYIYRSVDFADYNDYMISFHQNSFNLSLGGGLRYKLYKNINLVLETSLQINYSIANSPYPSDINNKYYDRYNNHLLLKYNPIRQLGISFIY